jgi:hypothetical protein
MTRPVAINLRFQDDGTVARAVLLWDQAPRTCAAIVEQLPVDGQSHHAMYSGSECVLPLKDKLKLAKENATSQVTKGQVAFAWLAAGTSYGVSDDISEICWFYDIDAQPRMWEGPVDVNIFAEICDTAPEFYAMCRRMRREGVKPLTIEVASA